MKFDNKSLIINHPALIAEWDWNKNIELKLEPNELLCGSNKRAWWRCALGHSWEAVIAERANGSGCPYCANKKVLAGYNDLASTNPELISEWNYSKNTELKVDGVTASSLKKVWWICEKGHEWEAAIASRTRGSGCPICANRKVLKGYNDLQTLFPAVAAEWHPTKNGETTPDEILAGTNAKFWWQCKFGHEWQCSVVDRTRRSSGCPICSGNQILEGFNDLASLRPDLIKEWHPTKNTILASTVGGHSSKKVWRRCTAGHEWDASVANRARGSGCPICSKQNSAAKQRFFDVFPELLSEWDSSLNAHLNCRTIPLKSAQYATWKCKHGHTWEASFANRSKGSSCPYCSGREVIPGKTDLETTNPALAKEWNYKKNAPLTPSQVSASTNKKVWWKCSLGHEWESSVNNRNKGSGCPVCAGKKAVPGFNDLATLSPNLSKEWHPTKNGSLLPSQVTKAYSTPVWWMCSEGHEWQATVGLRLGKGTQCPYCIGMRVVEGKTDLLTLNPELAKEWNYQKNGSLLPNMIAAQSNQSVWWRCKEGHEWEATVSNRNKGRGCPFCGNKQVLLGYNDLATTHPEIAAEWHPTKNGDLLPNQVTAGAKLSIWWVCSHGHEWKTTVFHRLHGTGCPVCSSDLRVSFPEKAVYYYISNAFSGVEENYHTDWLGRFELDIAIPSLKLGIEYDGEMWHTDTDRDSRKDSLCLENGYTLIRIREANCLPLESTSIIYQMKNNKSDLPKAIQYVFDFISEKGNLNKSHLNVDIERDRAEIAKLVGSGEYDDIQIEDGII